ncbi:MAG: YjjG family noncanonical pyrimidine nucleotidase [Butyricicoccus sp.]|nr:YjjG family noncanonical pyrimidine nucleotidase [Butyricicoccus sp.]
MAIKAILWDVDGTLLDFLAAEREAIRSCFARFGLGECPDDMIQRYSQINVRYWKRLEYGEITRDEVLLGRFVEFFASEGIETDAVAFNNEYQYRLGDTVVFIDDAYELVKRLRARVKQYAVTNGSLTAQMRKLTRSGLIGLFDGVFISEEIGFDKPRPEFFEHVFAHIPPFAKGEMLIVGDSLTSDMRGGNIAGVKCCWYNPHHAENGAGVHIDYVIDRLSGLEEII